MKKTLVIVIAAAVVFGGLAGCGGKATEKDRKSVV